MHNHLHQFIIPPTASLSYDKMEFLSRFMIQDENKR